MFLLGASIIHRLKKNNILIGTNEHTGTIFKYISLKFAIFVELNRTYDNL